MNMILATIIGKKRHVFPMNKEVDFWHDLELNTAATAIKSYFGKYEGSLFATLVSD